MIRRHVCVVSVCGLSQRELAARPEYLSGSITSPPSVRSAQYSFVLAAESKNVIIPPIHPLAPCGYCIESKQVLGGLHHDYRLEKEVA